MNCRVELLRNILKSGTLSNWNNKLGLDEVEADSDDAETWEKQDSWQLISRLYPSSKMYILSCIRIMIHFGVCKGSGDDWGEKIIIHGYYGWPAPFTWGILSNMGNISSWNTGPPSKLIYRTLNMTIFHFSTKSSLLSFLCRLSTIIQLGKPRVK